MSQRLFFTVKEFLGNILLRFYYFINSTHETNDVLSCLTSPYLVYFLGGLLTTIAIGLGITYCSQRFGVSHYNELWRVKKSVHSWINFRTSAQPLYCSYCRQLICGFWIFRSSGWECSVCGRTAHTRCLGVCNNFACKCPSQAHPLRHQLVQGNLPSGSLCCVCGILCSSPFGLLGLRCLWCDRTLHEECIHRLDDACDLGDFQGLILPPTIVKLSLAPASRLSTLPSLRALLAATTQSMPFSHAYSLKKRYATRTTSPTNIFNLKPRQNYPRIASTNFMLEQKTKETLSNLTPIDTSVPVTASTVVGHNNVDTNGLGTPHRVPQPNRVFNLVESPHLFHRPGLNFHSDSPTFGGTVSHGNTSSMKRLFPLPFPMNMNRSHMDANTLPNYSSEFLSCSSLVSRSNQRRAVVPHQRIILLDVVVHRRRRCRKGYQRSSTPPQHIKREQKERLTDRMNEIRDTVPVKARVWEICVSMFSRDISQSVTRPSSHDPPSSHGPLKRSGIHCPCPTSKWNMECHSLPYFELSSHSPVCSMATIPPSLEACSPLLVFINAKSGGQYGLQLFKEFYRYLNPLQVVDIQCENEPQRTLTMFRELAQLNRLRILVCGGDGTIGWVIDELQKIYGPPNSCRVPVGILPLGTGNDLARVLGWGQDFKGDVVRFLKKVENAQARLLDLWNIRVTPQGKKDPIIDTTFNNYVDIGVAAQVALKFHRLREAHPELFQSRLGNKFLYGEMGVRAWVKEKNLNLDHLQLWCDGKPVIFPEKKIQGLIIVNIPSFSGGIKLWDVESVNQPYPSMESPLNNNTVRQHDCVKPSLYSLRRHQHCTAPTSYPHASCIDSSLQTFLHDKKGYSPLQKVFERKCVRNPSHCSITAENRGCQPSLSTDIGHVTCDVPHPLHDHSSSIGTNSSMNRPVDDVVPENFSDSDHSSVSKKLSTHSAQESLNSTHHLDSYDFTDPKKYKRHKMEYSHEDSRRMQFFSTNSNASRFNKYKSYATHCWKKQSIRDEVIEVVAVRSLFHLGQIQVGLAEPLRVCQGHTIKIEVPVNVPLQINGEPRLVPACTIDITYKNGSYILSPSNSSQDVMMSTVEEVLNSAVHNALLTPHQRDVLFNQLNKHL